MAKLLKKPKGASRTTNKVKVTKVEETKEEVEKWWT